MTESERALASFHLRARVVLAIALLAFVGVAREADVAGPEIPARALAVGLALVIAAGIEELVARRADRRSAATAGSIAEFFAFALAVALFARFHPLAPGALLWPIVLGAASLRTTYLLYLAVVGGAIALEVALLHPGSTYADIVAALGWAALFASTAALAGALGQSYRRGQRHTESAYASVATVTAATSYPELARILVAFAERTLDLPDDAPAALLFDDRGIGTLAAVDARGVEPEQRARFRLAGPAVERLRALAGPDGAFVPGALAFDAETGAPDPFRTGRPFVLALRDARRLVGFAVFAARRGRRITAERRAELARVAGQVATTAVRIRGSRALEARRFVLVGALGAEGPRGAETQVTTWLARTARDIASAQAVAILRDLPSGDCRLVCAAGPVVADIEAGCLPIVEESRRRGAAVVVTDGERERRVALPAFLRTGAAALLPIQGEGLYLLVHHAERDGLSSGDLQLLVMLCEQAATFLRGAFAPPPAVPDPPGGPSGSGGPVVERRLAAVAAHTGGPTPGPEAETRARIIDAFRLAVEGNQPTLAGSGERVAAVAVALGEALRVDEAGRDALYVAALLRDVGELGIDRQVIDTPGALGPAQRELVQRHPVLGETILATLSYLGLAARIVRSHHERWDGSGYPDGLAATEIPLGARILAVADAFVAMTSERPYRAALRPAEAMAALIAGAGAAFDPAVTDAFVASSERGRIALGV